MSLYGDRYISCAALKRWVKTLDVTPFTFVDVGGRTIELIPAHKDAIRAQLDLFSQSVDALNDGDDWRSLQGILSPLFYNMFFRVDNNAVRVANYYECFIIPSNIKTYKKIISGFDYQDIGAVHIYDGDTPVAIIGAKSDLIWNVFYDYFINEEDAGDVVHTHMNPEKYMSIQLVDVENLSIEEIGALVNELLLRVSMEHDLDFTIAELDATYKLPGQAPIYKSQFHSLEFEHIPALYFSNALHSSDARMAYLSYYQVLEYFFVRAQNYNFLAQYNALPMSPINHNSLRKVLQNYKTGQSERESLKLVLKKAIDITAFKTWLGEDANRTTQYCHSGIAPIDPTKNDDKIIAILAERIYTFRCAIAHSKGDIDEFIAIPSVSDKAVLKEIELIKYLSYEALRSCSEV